MMHKLLVPLAVALMSLGAPCLAQNVAVKAAKPGGVYKAGEKIAWTVSVTGEGADAVSTVRYVLKKGGLTESAKGELPLKDGAATLETSLDAPGTLLAEFVIAPPEKKLVKALAGAVVEPEKIEPSAPPPADFDTFWNDKLKELAAVPANPVLEPAESGKEGVDYWKITLDNIRGTKIRGQLARPKAPGKRPALLIVQWAGVYPLAKDWATNQAQNGWLTLNINAHDLPIDAPAEFYKEQQEKHGLAGYPAIGNEDRDTSYFLRMYLSCYRAAEYLAGREDWDGKTLVVMGSSQGGLQSIMIAGLHPKVTALMANVPAGCDQTGPLVGRQPGWPMWFYQTRGKDAEKVKAASRYYDVVNFARRVTCPALISAGLIDETCPPAGIIAAYNQLKGQRELVVMEHSDHQGRNNTQAEYYVRLNAWLKELAAGKSVPPGSGK